jgi:putative membrane protein
MRWLVSAVAVAVAAWLVPGIEITGNGAVVVLVVAAVLGLMNALVRPILTCLTLPVVALTLGLFLLVINAIAFWLASWVSSQWLGAGFHVDGFLAAFLGSLVVSVVATLLNLFLPDSAG